jgi:Sulfotransferase domain
MKKVDALLIGGGRSGTTTLYKLLQQHPQVNWSETKEVPYFSISTHFNKGEKYFHSFFKDGGKDVFNITSDTYLLNCKDCIQRIKSYNPQMKLIVMLRHPVQRAISAYRYGINNGYIKPEIKIPDLPEYENDWLKKGNAVEISNHCPLYGSRYHLLLTKWEKHFARDQILLLKTSDFKNDPFSMSGKIHGFLGIDHVSWNNEDKVFNKASGTKSKWVQQILVNRNHPIRKSIGWIIRPFRKWIAKTGIVDTLKNLNQKQTPVEQMDEEALDFLEQNLKQDMLAMGKEWDIHFEK